MPRSSPTVVGLMRRMARSSSASVTSSTSMTVPMPMGRIQRWRPRCASCPAERGSHGGGVEGRRRRSRGGASSSMRSARSGSAPRRCRDGGDGPQAQHDRLAMRQPVATLDLEGVAEGVAQVEGPSLTALEWVAVDDAQLEAHRALDHGVAGRLVGAASPGARRGSPAAPTARVADDRGLERPPPGRRGGERGQRVAAPRCRR